MRQPDLFRTPKRPWNAGPITGPKASLKPKHIWAIRQQLKANGRRRDLAMFNCAIDAKLRACDLVRRTVSTSFDTAMMPGILPPISGGNDASGKRTASKSPTRLL